MGRDFHERLRQGFLTIASAESQRCVVIDAARSPECVQADILAAIEARLGKP